MARKDLLKGLMGEPPAPQDGPARVDAARPRYTTGAIGAVSQSIADLKSRSIAEIAADRIEDGGLRDRLDEEPAEIEALMASIRDYGQQVPVLVRPHPEKPEHFQIVYGRRRLAALRRLGQPVKAMVRSLDDREVVVAQGQENSARKDLSFVEKAIFAAQLREAGYDRRVICDALHVDKTVISRMLSVADRLPMPLIEAIGPAPGIGRDRWLALADLVEGGVDSVAATAEAQSAGGLSSDKRFAAVFAWAASAGRRRRPAAEPAQVVHSAEGREIARVQRRATAVTLTLRRDADGAGFEDWLIAHLEEIHRSWKAGGGG